MFEPTNIGGEKDIKLTLGQKNLPKKILKKQKVIKNVQIRVKPMNLGSTQNRPFSTHFRLERHNISTKAQ